ALRRSRGARAGRPPPAAGPARKPPAPGYHAIVGGDADRSSPYVLKGKPVGAMRVRRPSPLTTDAWLRRARQASPLQGRRVFSRNASPAGPAAPGPAPPAGPRAGPTAPPRRPALRPAR